MNYDNIIPQTHRRPKFILIEQSLRNLGGHHFEYAFEIMRAAEDAGYEPILAVNRDFEEFDRFPSDWQVFPLFPYRSDRIHRIPKAASLAPGKRLLGGDVGGAFDGVVDRFKSKFSGLRWRRRKTRVEGFARACGQLFQKVTLEAGDQVYCCTMSDMDLLGLVRFLKSRPESEMVDWHLQFHFGVFTGRDPNYAAQFVKVRRLRQRLQTAIQALPGHRLHFYTTTDELRRQFNWLGAAEFQTLPWPVSPRFQRANCRTGFQPVRDRLKTCPTAPDGLKTRPTASDGLKTRPTDSAAPLRLVCAGGVRREKGGQLVGPLIRALDDEFLKSNKVQLLIQTGKKRKSRTMLGLEPGVAAELEEFSSEELPGSSVVALPHPLPPDAYADLIRSADVGLLLYDADEYFARCSGILVELLAAGVPVIGPAGCWLGRQIEQANRDYLRNLLQTSATVGQWSFERAKSAVDNGRRGAACKFDLEASGADLLVRLTTSPSAGWGTFARVNLKQFAADGKKTGELAAIVAADGENQSADSFTLFPIHARTARVRLTVENAYDASSPFPVRQIDAFVLNRAGGERHQPMGRIGLTMASSEFIPQLLRDVVANFDYYRASAEEFAVAWKKEHAPARTIEKLTATANAMQDVALRDAS